MRFRALGCVFAFVVLSGLGTLLFGQQPPSNLTFEVASIKLNKFGDDRAYVSIYTGGRYSATNTR